MAEQKFYVVWVGLKPGIYRSWDECKAAVEGFPNAKYKSFKTFGEAQNALKGNVPSFTGGASSSKSSQKSSVGQPILESLSVDAACSGNPGVMEYRGVHVATKEVWFHQTYELGTNNIGEFLGLVHGLAELKKRNLTIPIYTDSMTALAWVRNKKCKTQLPQTEKTERLFEVVERAENWLKNNSYTTRVLKWETEQWGEIPADFGRK